MTQASPDRRMHLVVVDAYSGILEPVGDDPAARASGWALGLPLDELLLTMDARATVLSWEPWLELERSWQLFTTWTVVPATRSVEPPPPRAPLPTSSTQVRVHQIAATDPGDGRPLAVMKPSLRGFGLLADSDPMVYFSCRLAQELRTVHAEDPIDLVIVPMWGGLGAISQIERAAGVSGALNVPTAVVVTDSARNRRRVDQEGLWSRETVYRIQMEDLSLALADAVLSYGPRADAISSAGRLRGDEAAIRVPRRIPVETLDAIGRLKRIDAAPPEPVQLFSYGPMTPASGGLALLDAVRLLADERPPPSHPVICAGADARFAPMAPRTFRDYWSSRAWVREMEKIGWWQWEREKPRFQTPSLRLHIDPWAHLADPWSDLARGSMLLLAPAVADDLAPGMSLPSLATLPVEPDANSVASAIARLLDASPAALEYSRVALCEAVAEAHAPARRAEVIRYAAERLAALVHSAVPQAAQPVDRVWRMLLDRRKALAGSDDVPDAAIPEESDKSPKVERDATLTIVIPCHGLGELVRATVDSVWASTRLPDELIIVDDGSPDSETRVVLDALEQEARARRLPLRIERQRNRGLAAARNAGLKSAQGELIVFLDGDDLIEPEYFATACELLQRWPGLGGVAAWSVIFDESGDTGHWNAPQPELPLQLVENTVFVPMMMRTDLLRRLGGVDERQRYNYEDWEMSCRLLCEGWPILTIPRYLQRYRVRRDSLLRSLTPAQHQVMRELLLERHRDTAARFAVELPMLVESRLARWKQVPEESPPGMLEPRRMVRAGQWLVRDLARVVGEILGARTRGLTGAHGSAAGEKSAR